MQRVRKHKWLVIFIICLCICLLAVGCLLAAAAAKYGNALEGVLRMARYAFSDFGQVIHFTLSPDPYEGAFCTMYTPLNFLFYAPFAFICSFSAAFNTLGEVSPDEYNMAIVQTWEFWTAILLYFGAVFTAMYFVLQRRIPLARTSDKVFFFFSLLFSTLVAFGFIRGSNVFVAFVFFMLYLNMYDSHTRWKRELALVFFAVAGVMKYYLLFGGILLIKHSRWGDVIKCVAYCLILFFAPFLAYRSPWHTIMAYIRNMFSFTSEQGRVGSATNISAYNLVYLAFSAFHAEGTLWCTVLCWAATIGSFILGLYLCIRRTGHLAELTVMCCTFCLVPAVSYLYVLVFMIPAFLEFMRTCKELSRARRIYYICFFAVMLFTPLMVLKAFWIYSLLLVSALVAETVLVCLLDYCEREKVIMDL